MIRLPSRLFRFAHLHPYRLSLLTHHYSTSTPSSSSPFESASSPSSPSSTSHGITFKAGTEDELLTSLRYFKKHQLPLPFEFNDIVPVEKILDGKRKVVTDTSELKFDCTACGRCCRIYAPSVMLDPFDVFLVSRSPKLAISSTTTKSLYSAYPKAVSVSFAALSEHGGKIPAAFLTVNESGECYFAAPLSPNVVTETSPESEVPSPSIASESKDDGLKELVNNAKLNSTRRRARLYCKLGSEHQPTPCALYPLGELYETKINVKSGGSSTKSYFTIDSECEGVNAPHATVRTVNEYIVQHSNGIRQIFWRWFRNLAMEVGESCSIQQQSVINAQSKIARGKRFFRSKTKSLKNPYNLSPEDQFYLIYLHALSTIWFDFDSSLAIQSLVNASRGDDDASLDKYFDLSTLQNLSNIDVELLEEWIILHSAIDRTTKQLVEIAKRAVEHLSVNAEEAVARFIADLKEKDLYQENSFMGNSVQ